MKVCAVLHLLLLNTEAFLYPSSHSRRRTSLAMLPSTSDSLNEAKRQISRAISVGAPAYNSGDVQKCADVYKDAAEQILPLLPSAFQTKLSKEISDSASTNKPDSTAWALRRIFDSIIDYTPPIIPTGSDESLSCEQFTPNQIGQPVQVMDNVMGGISTGDWNAASNTFSGITCLANDGGFSSIRWRFSNVQNWCYAKGVYIKGLKHSNPKEHTFNILLKDDTCERVRLANYKAAFANPDQCDEMLLIPFSVFNQMEQMGRAQVGSPAFNPLAVTEIGVMASKPSVVGSFYLEFSEWGLYL